MENVSIGIKVKVHDVAIHFPRFQNAHHGSYAKIINIDRFAIYQSKMDWITGTQ